MPDRDAIDERLRAVERALTDDDRAPADLAEAAAVEDRLEDLARRTAAVEERVEELDAAVQALRGYVGNVRAVNDDVERRADAALAKVESLAREESPDGGSAVREGAPTRGDGPPTRGPNPGREGRARRPEAGVARPRPDAGETDASGADYGTPDGVDRRSTDGADEGGGLLDRLGEVL